MIVHILRGGRAVCGFGADMLPGQWPEGHKWVSFEAPGDVNCKQCCMFENVLTKSERERVLEAMRHASHRFYMAAATIACHPFIEFTGLMNEYIKICAGAHAEGINFPSCNVHSGHALPIKKHEAEYLAEKLECIYGPSLTDPEIKRAFLERLFHD